MIETEDVRTFTPDDPDDPGEPPFELFERLKKDIREAALTLTVEEARYLVDAYYQRQEARKRGENQCRAQDREPNRVLTWLADNDRRVETAIKGILGAHAERFPVGRWALAQYGIGPIISAGLLAHINIEKAPHVGHLWSFAGLAAGQDKKWTKGTKRPWNARLKVIMWKCGQSWLKFSGRPQCYYGHLYLERKTLLWEQNLAGKFQDAAGEKLERFKIGETTDARKWYTGCVTADAAHAWLEGGRESENGRTKIAFRAPGSGTIMLPPAHIDARARRWVVKLFLSHWHEVAFFVHFKKLPADPYVLSILGHADRIEYPGVDEVEGLGEAIVAAGRILM
ncbi:hypothetical protein HY493_03435 [Candidatus Woesearchaeota archaeon]|nr:hypothetical protein [Candidatus Woesearchaeota archaeon]